MKERFEADDKEKGAKYAQCNTAWNSILRITTASSLPTWSSNAASNMASYTFWYIAKDNGT
jgi:hypothetical protein